jgi:hypothetical protein
MNRGKFLVLLFSLVTLTSCGSIVKGLSGFKNPRVENKEQLSKYFDEVMPNESTYFLTVEKVGDSAAIFDSFFFGFSSEMKIFSKSGQKYCYYGTSECSGAQMTSAFGEFEKTFMPCEENSDETLQSLISKLVDKEGKQLLLTDLPDSDYYIFQNWDKYSGSKKKLKEDAKWISNLKQNSKLNTTIIFINGDLVEDWGLEKNGKLKTKFRKEGKGLSFDITFGKLPLIK